jgi:hypothetical protein
VIAVRGMLGALLVAVAFPAAAYKQTCVSGSQGQSVCLAWPTRNVAWKLNSSRPSSSQSCAATSAGDPVVLEIAKASFQGWQDATRAGETSRCTDLTFSYGGTSSSIVAGGDTNEHLVLFREGWCSQNTAAQADPCFATATCGNKFGCFDDEGGLGKSTLALTSVSYRTDGTIVDADTEIVDWDGGTGPIDSAVADGIYVTCYTSNAPSRLCTSYGQADCTYYDLQNTLTHELGHFIGIAHPCGSGSGNPPVSCSSGNFADVTMYPFEVPGETKKRDLSADDVTAVCEIYAPKQGGSGGGGCATGPGFAGATLLALLALTLRRKR